MSLLTAILVVMGLPLDFAGKLMVFRTQFLPGGLHGFEASRISFNLLRGLRSGFVAVVWSKMVHVEPFCPCLTSRLVAIMVSTLSSARFLRSRGCFVCSILLPVGVLGMVLSIFWLRALALLGSFGGSQAWLGSSLSASSWPRGWPISGFQGCDS